MLAALNNVVLSVHREHVGPLDLENPPLKQGEWRVVGKEELAFARPEAKKARDPMAQQEQFMAAVKEVFGSDPVALGQQGTPDQRSSV